VPRLQRSFRRDSATSPEKIENSLPAVCPEKKLPPRWPRLRQYNSVQEDSRAVWRWPSIEGFFADLCYALRTLRKTLGFTATARLSRAWDRCKHIYFYVARCDPFAQPARAKPAGTCRSVDHGLRASRDGPHQQYGELTAAVAGNPRPAAVLFRRICLEREPQVRGRGSEMRHFHELRVSGDFFRVLGVRPFRGRLLMPEEEGRVHDERGRQVLVLAGRTGRTRPERRYQAVVDNELVEIIGVTPPELYGMVVGEGFDIAIPYCQGKMS